MPPLPKNETARLEALRRYRLLDTPPEPAFDDFAIIASAICETPIALVSLVDAERQWFKARIGMEATELPREHAFCAHTICQEQFLVIPDAAQDQRFSANPLVTGEPRIRFYAGSPIIDRDGHALGSLCVIDREPRRLTEQQVQTLTALTRRVMAELEYRHLAASLADALSEVKTLQGFLSMCSNCKKLRTDSGEWVSLESYLHTHTESQLSHGLCAPCFQRLYPDIYLKLQSDDVLGADGELRR